MSEWQPIESAPKDGGLCDLWIEPKDEFTGAPLIPCRVADAYFEGGRWYISGRRVALRVWHNPTYWMPLPSAPAGER